uniref:Nerve growth factor receptor n=1 Tax=Scophthalmus maximus TaxID=52904 RepID=A0A8D3DK03_SCOMX
MQTSVPSRYFNLAGVTVTTFQSVVHDKISAKTAPVPIGEHGREHFGFKRRERKFWLKVSHTHCLSHHILCSFHCPNLLHLFFFPSPISPLLASFHPSSRTPAGETFSENYSHAEQCKPCTQCTGLMRLQTPCTDSNDAICACNYNYFFNGISGRCEPCTVCPTGEGVYTHCDHDHDTVCEECVDDTFSDRESSLEPCLPCTICDEETEVQLGVCAPTYDSVCHSKSSPRATIPFACFSSIVTTFYLYFTCVTTLPQSVDGSSQFDEVLSSC